MGCLRAVTIGWQAHVVAKIQVFWASIAAGALQPSHAPYLLLSQLHSLEFSCQESLWTSWLLEAKLLSAHRTCGGSSFLFPPGKGKRS